MTDPDRPVHVVAHRAPALVLGVDDQGRTLVRCPNPSCGETAVVQADGRVICPVGDRHATALEQRLAAYTDWTEPEDDAPEWALRP